MRTQIPRLDRRSPVPLAEQIARHYSQAIEAGRLRPGDRLPAIRAVAERTDVTRATVQEAYRRLSEHGFVIGVVGRGTTVTGPLRQGRSSRGALSPFAVAALRQVQEAPVAPEVPAGDPVVANFADLPPDPALFPVDDLRAALDRALRDGGGEILAYGHPAGVPDLRRALAERRHVADPEATADDILVTTGAQQGIDLVSRTFASPGDRVAVPVPTYQQLFGLLKAQGLELVPVRSGAAGVDLEDLERVLSDDSVRLLYLMPTFHNPTGRSMDLAQRSALMDIVQRTDVPVLEDEYEQPLRFAGAPLPSLRGLDRRGLTVTVLTFSKGLFPGLRMGWVQAGRGVLAPMAAIKRFMDLETSPLLQAALLELIRDGSLDRYLGNLRSLLAERHGAMRAALRQYMPEECRWSEPEGGFALWVRMPGEGQGDLLAQRAAAAGVMVTPGRVFDPLGLASNGFRISLSRTDPERIDAGCRVLGNCAHELVGAHLSSQPRLFL